jgi:hypothetical protein
MLKKLSLGSIILSAIALAGCWPAESYGPPPTILSLSNLTPKPDHSHDMQATAPAASVQVLFTGIEGASIEWDATSQAPDEAPRQETLQIPGRRHLDQGELHRLKLTKIPGHEKLELHLRLELLLTPRTEAFIAGQAIEVPITDADITCVIGGNYLTKVIYLIDPEGRQAGVKSIREISSKELPPGVDPIIEADRAGSIIAVLRMVPPRR